MSRITTALYSHLLLCIICFLIGGILYQPYQVNSSNRYPSISHAHTAPHRYERTHDSVQPIILKPDAFTKIYPEYAQTITSSGIQLQWSKSEGASRYEYCYAASPRLCTTWTSVGTNLFAYIPLKRDGSYYWQVRAINTSGITLADTRIWYFIAQRNPTTTPTSTIVRTPTVTPSRTITVTLTSSTTFGKQTPLNNSTHRGTRATLSWNHLRNARIYEYCITTSNLGCTNWINAGYTTQITVSSLQIDKIYYWQVRAKLTNGSTIYAKEGIWRFRTTN